MKYIGVILAVGTAALVVVAIGILNFQLIRENEAAVVTEAAPVVVEEPTIPPDLPAVRAAFDAREQLLQKQIEDLDAAYADRQQTYELRVQELNGLIGESTQRLAQAEDEEGLLKEQIVQLQAAQTERATNYESQRQQANYQYQVNVQQLQSQLNEAAAKLQEAQARLGQ